MEKLTRTFALPDEPLKRSEGNQEIFPIAISSETPVLRGAGYEVLDHSLGSIILDRLKDGAAFLFNHKYDDHLGIISNPRIGPDRVLRGEVRFGESELAKEKKRDVENGTLKWISVSYSVLAKKWERQPRGDQPGTYRAIKWEPLEVSLVTVPADATVGVGRSLAPLTPSLDYLRDRLAEISVPDTVSQLEREQQQARVRLAKLKV